MRTGQEAEVRQVVDAGVAAQTGLRQNDRILRVNGTLLDSPAAVQRVLISLRAGATARFEIVRDGQLLNFTSTLQGLPREQLQGVETVHDAALTDLGFRVRTIVTRPRNATGKLPAVFLVGWLSCDSVEYPFGPSGDGFGQLLHDIATQSGRATFVKLPKTDHLFMTFENMSKAFKDEGGRYNKSVTEHVLTFLREDRNARSR